MGAGDLKGYLIEKYNNMSGAYTCRRLLEEAGKLGMDLRIVGINDTEARPEGIFNAGEKLEPVDFVINRYKWGKLKDAINGLAGRTYNPLPAYNLYINKYEQVRRLTSDVFLKPKYILGTAALPFGQITAELGIPVVAKGLESSMGREIFLVHNDSELKKMAAGYSPEKEWLFEEYIASSYGRDMRFYSIRGNVAACMQRKSAGDFRANVALGASVEPLEITDEIRTIAKDIYDQTGLDFLGIDLLFGKDKPYFCEINVMPGIEGIEKASGKNIAREICGTIKGDFDPEAF